MQHFNRLKTALSGRHRGAGVFPTFRLRMRTDIVSKQSTYKGAALQKKLLLTAHMHEHTHARVPTHTHTLTQ